MKPDSAKLRIWQQTMPLRIQIQIQIMAAAIMYTKIHITMTPLWARWRLKSPASRLFAQPFIQAQIKENIKAPRHWPLCAEFTGDRWIPRTNGQLRGKCFHLMTSSWSRSLHNRKYTMIQSTSCLTHKEMINNWSNIKKNVFKSNSLLFLPRD